MLASAGYRVIVPEMRGHGTTRLLADTTVRTASRGPCCRYHRADGWASAEAVVDVTA
jgi:esterase/lipase